MESELLEKRFPRGALRGTGDLVGRFIEVAGLGNGLVLRFIKDSAVFSDSKHEVEFVRGDRHEVLLRRPKFEVFWNYGLYWRLLEGSDAVDKALAMATAIEAKAQAAVGRLRAELGTWTTIRTQLLAQASLGEARAYSEALPKAPENSANVSEATSSGSDCGSSSSSTTTSTTTTTSHSSSDSADVETTGAVSTIAQQTFSGRLLDLTKLFTSDGNEEEFTSEARVATAADDSSAEASATIIQSPNEIESKAANLRALRSGKRLPTAQDVKQPHNLLDALCALLEKETAAAQGVLAAAVATLAAVKAHIERVEDAAAASDATDAADAQKGATPTVDGMSAAAEAGSAYASLADITNQVCADQAPTKVLQAKSTPKLPSVARNSAAAESGVDAESKMAQGGSAATNGASSDVPPNFESSGVVMAAPESNDGLSSFLQYFGLGGESSESNGDQAEQGIKTSIGDSSSSSSSSSISISINYNIEEEEESLVDIANQQVSSLLLQLITVRVSLTDLITQREAAMTAFESQQVSLEPSSSNVTSESDSEARATSSSTLAALRIEETEVAPGTRDDEFPAAATTSGLPLSLPSPCAEPAKADVATETTTHQLSASAPPHSTQPLVEEPSTENVRKLAVCSEAEVHGEQGEVDNDEAASSSSELAFYREEVNELRAARHAAELASLAVQANSPTCHENSNGGVERVYTSLSPPLGPLHGSSADSLCNGREELAQGEGDQSVERDGENSSNDDSTAAGADAASRAEYKALLSNTLRVTSAFHEELMQFRVREKSGCSSPSSDRSHHVGEDDEDEEDCDDDEDGRFATLRSATIGPGAEGSGPSSPPAHLRDRPNIFQGSSARNVLEFRRLAIAAAEFSGQAELLARGFSSSSERSSRGSSFSRGASAGRGSSRPRASSASGSYVPCKSPTSTPSALSPERQRGSSNRRPKDGTLGRDSLQQRLHSP